MTSNPPNFANIYEELFRYYGDLGWWPAETKDEIVIGAILTQNTSWKNVEKAIANLKSHGITKLEDVCKIEKNEIAKLIRSSGFYNQKAERLKAVSCLIVGEFNGIDRIKDIDAFAERLKSIKGIGQETLNSILLYALDAPVFVIDKYTVRFLERYSSFDEVDSIKKSVEEQLADVKLMQNFHAMIVQLSKDFCRKEPICMKCPLKACSTGQRVRKELYSNNSMDPYGSNKV
ncbi:endonuclease III domain-containing protein [Thermoplasma volcanium]|nr:endonuclease III domain-containing protein [Thermoplasma volcanium]